MCVCVCVCWRESWGGGGWGGGVKFKVRGVKKKSKEFSGRGAACTFSRPCPNHFMGPCRFGSSLRVWGFSLFGSGGGVDLLPCGEREEHGPRRRLDSKLNRGGDECDADLHAMASPMLFQLAGWPVQRRRPAILFRSA